MGGEFATYFASIVCPLGYIREHQVVYGPGKASRFKLDFALPEAKIDIELDGPYHYSLPEEDVKRDLILRNLGWHVIRISHD